LNRSIESQLTQKNRARKQAASRIDVHLIVVLIAALVCGACRNAGLPRPGTKTYADLCSSFYLGLAGLQSGEDVRAKQYLTRSTEIAPGEPAGWVDLGILQVRQQQFDAAFASVDKSKPFLALSKAVAGSWRKPPHTGRTL
jgi:hypothetical protein